jgi:hypothetical protein
MSKLHIPRKSRKIAVPQNGSQNGIIAHRHVKGVVPHYALSIQFCPFRWDAVGDAWHVGPGVSPGSEGLRR